MKTSLAAFIIASLLALPFTNSNRAMAQVKNKLIYRDGGIVRCDTTKKEITLVFTAADKADGAEAIMATLKKYGIKGGFFFTGEFYERFPQVVTKLRQQQHYVGGHSYGHLLYCDWDDRNHTLVSREEFIRDMNENYRLMNEAGISRDEAPLFLPPFEHYNAEIVEWTESLGLQLVNFTPGTWTNADYTTPDMKNYRSSKDIFDRVMQVEAQEGLNGHIMLVHLGTVDQRTDKFYDTYLDLMIHTLIEKGYSFVPLRQAVGLSH